MGLLESARVQAKRLKRETYALYFVARDPRTPWYARLLCAAVVAYALSPLDLIPDFVPVLGYLDDLVIVPLGIALTLRLVPADVLSECRERARVAADKPVSRAGAIFVIAVWLALAVVAIWLIRDVLVA